MVSDTLDALLTRTCNKYADRPMVEFRGRTVTYEQVNRRADALARGLYELGLGRDDRVGFMLSNRPEYLVSNLAVAKAGGIWVPLNDMLDAGDMRYMLGDARARFAVVGPNFAEDLSAISEDLPLLEHAVVVGDEDLEIDGVETHAYERFLEEYEQAPDVEPAPEDVVAQYYTGGTTGRPKGVVHTHENFVLDLYSHVMELDIGRERMLLMTPLPHSAGLFALAGMLKGATVVTTQGFDPDRALELIDTEQITWTFMVPTMIYRVLDHPDVETTAFDSLETLTYGAAPMTPERIREGLATFGPVFQQFYGQTEIPNLITTLTKDDHTEAVDRDREEVLNSAGRPVAMSEVKIVDVETGEAVPPGEDGEILARAPYSLVRYYNRPEKNAETIEDGWVRTGDIGRIDEEGFVYLLDRDSDMIISGGMNVYSTEVEGVIEEHESVAQCAVIGIPHDEWGEAVHAVVVPYEESVSEAAIRSFCRDRLADYKRPKSIEFVDTLPETPYGKIDKKALREPYWQEAPREIH